MAKPEGKSKGGKVVLDDELDDIPAQSSEQVQVAEVAKKQPEVVAATPVIETTNEDLVRFSCFVNVDPAPVVGSPSHGGYSFIDQGIMKLEARKNYTIPRRVALHLTDKKIGQIVG